MRFPRQVRQREVIRQCHARCGNAMMSHRRSFRVRSSADSVEPSQQLGSKTCVDIPAPRSAPARRQTPRGGARMCIRRPAGRTGDQED